MTLEKVTWITRIGSHGNSLMVLITKSARLLDLDRGDLVEITIKKVESEGE